MSAHLLATASVGAPNPLAVLLPVILLVLLVDIYCLRDLARAPSVRYLPKFGWALVILFVSAPFGAMIYLFAGRDRYRGPR